ncbi:hypothetical protein DFH09DRAFT_1201846 [Mycena vulgaris]|nr:hypothetical protein DFH09DRAFT_1201846 [Mycena vulgaris]
MPGLSLVGPRRSVRSGNSALNTATNSLSVHHWPADPPTIAYWLACYPLDVIKSHIQLRGTPPAGTPVQYIGHEVKLKLIVAESGFVGLFCGLSPSLSRRRRAPSQHLAWSDFGRRVVGGVTRV